MYGLTLPFTHLLKTGAHIYCETTVEVSEMQSDAKPNLKRLAGLAKVIKVMLIICIVFSVLVVLLSATEMMIGPVPTDPEKMDSKQAVVTFLWGISMVAEGVMTII